MHIFFRISCTLAEGIHSSGGDAFPDHQQFVFTASGKVHDLKATAALTWSAGWTYLFDRGYFSFDLLTALLHVGAHFVVRLKQGVEYRII